MIDWADDKGLFGVLLCRAIRSCPLHDGLAVAYP